MFRVARQSDLDAVLSLYSQLNGDDPALDRAIATTIFNAIVENPDLSLFVLEQGGEVVASTYLNVILNLSRSGSPYAVIENVIVEASLRGKGLGKEIMAETLQAAWSRGCYKAMLMTGSTSPSTHAFYRACGFSGDAKTAYLARPNHCGQSPVLTVR